MRIAAVVADGGLAFYRHRLPARALAGRGISFHEVNGADLPVTTDAAGRVTAVDPIDADVLVLQRPMGAIWRQVIPLVQANGTAVVIDVDDRFPNLHPGNSAWKLVHPSQNPDHNYDHLAASCALADLVTVSTPPLTEVYGGHGRVRVLRNCVPGEFLDLDVEPDDCFGWSGWIGSHPDDLRVLGGAVAGAVANGRRFRVVGPADEIARQLGLADVEATGWVDFDEYPEELARLGVALAPLTDTIFNTEGKSFLKPLEAMAVGVPVICSDIAEYRLLTDAGAGLVAATPGEWARALKRSEDSAWRAEQREAGREVAARWRIEHHVHGWAEAWSDAVAIRRAARSVSSSAPATVIPVERGPGAVVFGMHRSGTSAIASALAALGLEAGADDELLPAADDNPLGFFELEAVNRVNDDVLASIDHSWAEPPADPTVFAGSIFDTARHHAGAVLADILPTHGWLLKDPRVSVLWPFWAPLFPAAPAGVLIARSPVEVAESLHRRNDLPHEVGLALWEHYNRAALRAVATLEHHLVITYDQLLSDPAMVEARVRSVLDAAGVDVAAQPGVFAGIVHGELRRAVPSTDVAITQAQAALWSRLQTTADQGIGAAATPIDPPIAGAVRDAIRRTDEGGAHESRRAARTAGPDAVDVSIIIPCFNKVEYTIQCLSSLAEHTPDERYEVVLVDNASSDATPDLCAQLDGDVIVIRNDVNLGFSKACNQGAAAARGRHLLFLNNDTEALPGWLEPLLDVIDHEPDVAAVGSRLLFPDRTLQHAGVINTEREGEIPVAPVHDFYRYPAHHPPANVRRDLEVVTGACVLFRREAFVDAGGFDEGYWNGFEDVDLCFTVRRDGWRVVYEPASTLIHHESISGPERFRMTDENIRRLQERWTGQVPVPWLDTAAGARRVHPGVARTEIRIEGPTSDPLAIERSITAARLACRGDDIVSISAEVAAACRFVDRGVHVGAPLPDVSYRLTLAAGVRLDRDCVDRLLGMAADDSARRAGPVFLDGPGEQHPSAWLDAVPDSPAACRTQLKNRTNAWRRVATLDPRCILERLEGPAAGVDIVVRSAVVLDAPALVTA